MPQFSYISRLSYQHCIHDRRRATKFGTHIRLCDGTDSNQKNLTHPIPGVARGDFRGSTIQKSGKCHELPRKSTIFFFKTHPTPAGPSGDFRGSKMQKSGKCHGLPRKSIIFVNPYPTLWLGVYGSTFLKV